MASLGFSTKSPSRGDRLRTQALSLFVILAGIALSAGASGLADSSALPTPECVEQLRAARIQAASGQQATALQLRLGAVDLPTCEVAALADLLGTLQTGGLSDDETTKLRDRMVDRVTDPAQSLAPGLTSYLAASTTTFAEQELLLQALQDRRRALEAGESATSTDHLAELVATSVHLQLALEKVEDARLDLDTLLALAPSEDLEWKALQLDEQLQRWEAVATRTERLLARPNAPTHLRTMRALALAHLGRYDEMLSVLETMAPPPPTGPEVPAVTMYGDPQPSHFAGLLLAAAWALRDGGRDHEAEQTFRRVLLYTTGHPDGSAATEAEAALLHLYGSSAERAQHREQEAERRQAETDPQSLYEEASRLLAAGDAEVAYSMLERAAPKLRETPFEEAAWYNLGIAAFRLEHWQAAADALAQAIRLQPERGPSYHQRGIALFQLGRCDEVIPVLEEALRLLPNRYQAHYYLAQCYRQLGRTDAADRAQRLYAAGSD